MSTFYALSNLKHNGSKYSRADEVVGLDKKQAEELLDLGVISNEKPEPVIDEASARIETKADKVKHRAEKGKTKTTRPAEVLEETYDEEADEESDDEGTDLDNLNYKELQKEAKSPGLNAGGSAEDLKVRITEFLEEKDTENIADNL